MDVTPNAILVVDGNLRVQDLSRSAEEMFTCSRTYARGKSLQSLVPIVDDFISVRDTGQPVLNRVVRFAKAGNGQGEIIVEQTVVPVTGPSAAHDQQDRALLVAILRDVTAREREHRELELIHRRDRPPHPRGDRQPDARGPRDTRGCSVKRPPRPRSSSPN